MSAELDRSKIVLCLGGPRATPGVLLLGYRIKRIRLEFHPVVGGRRHRSADF
jgi:hypothetical protein